MKITAIKWGVFGLGLALLGLGCAGSAPRVGGGAGPNRGGGAALPWASGGLKFGYIRSDVIMQRYLEYRDVENTLQSENRQWLAEAERMESEIRRLEIELDELSLILSDERRAEMEKTLTDKRRELQKYRQDTWYSDNNRYLKRRRELMEPVDARVNDAIWRVAQDMGLDLVFDTVAGNIVYSKPGLDITGKVLEELQR